MKMTISPMEPRPLKNTVELINPIKLNFLSSVIWKPQS